MARGWGACLELCDLCPNKQGSKNIIRWCSNSLEDDFSQGVIIQIVISSLFGVEATRTSCISKPRKVDLSQNSRGHLLIHNISAEHILSARQALC